VGRSGGFCGKERRTQAVSQWASARGAARQEYTHHTVTAGWEVRRAPTHLTAPSDCTSMLHCVCVPLVATTSSAPSTRPLPPWPAGSSMLSQ